MTALTSPPANPDEITIAVPPAQNRTSREPAHRGWHRKWLVPVLSALVLTSIMIALNEGRASTISPSAPPSPTLGTSAANGLGVLPDPTWIAVAPALPGIGVVVRDQEFEFVVQSVKRGGAASPGERVAVKAQDEFVIITIQVTNILAEPRSFYVANVRLVDVRGQQYTPLTDATEYSNGSIANGYEIGPREVFVGQAAFDVPISTALSTIQLNDASHRIRVQL